METAFDYVDDRVAWFTTDELKWKRRLDEWAKEYPQECVIRTRPEDNGGCMVANVPASWLRVRPPLKRNMTDEQRAALSERARNLFTKKDNIDEEETEDDE